MKCETTTTTTTKTIPKQPKTAREREREKHQNFRDGENRTMKADEVHKKRKNWRTADSYQGKTRPTKTVPCIDDGAC